MKKTLVLILMIFVVFAFCSCLPDKEDEDNNTSIKELYDDSPEFSTGFEPPQKGVLYEMTLASGKVDLQSEHSLFSKDNVKVNLFYGFGEHEYDSPESVSKYEIRLTNGDVSISIMRDASDLSIDEFFYDESGETRIYNHESELLTIPATLFTGTYGSIKVTIYSANESQEQNYLTHPTRIYYKTDGETVELGGRETDITYFRSSVWTESVCDDEDYEETRKAIERKYNFREKDFSLFKGSIDSFCVFDAILNDSKWILIGIDSVFGQKRIDYYFSQYQEISLWTSYKFNYNGQYSIEFNQFESCIYLYLWNDDLAIKIKNPDSNGGLNETGIEIAKIMPVKENDKIRDEFIANAYNTVKIDDSEYIPIEENGKYKKLIKKHNGEEIVIFE
ncbi:MAG: hypothetical protein IJY23_04385 [Clostridia bacterium]|nr:hypothetical protein [Clostridia bacterium]